MPSRTLKKGYNQIICIEKTDDIINKKVKLILGHINKNIKK